MSESAVTGRPTLRDVGRLAGVSQTTASLVLGGRNARIRAQTRQRILDAAAQLDYRPNRAAQGLRLGRSRTIGFVTEGIASTGFSGPLISGTHDLAWQRDSLMLMVNSTQEEGHLLTAVRDLLDRQVDSIIYASVGTREVHFPDVPAGTPTIMLNAFDADDRYPAVLPDERAGGRAAVEHLLALGHERIGFIAGLSDAWATRMRELGFREGLIDAGLDPDAMPVVHGNYHLDSGYELTDRLVRERPDLTALLLGNDQMASGALLALARLGVRVPEDLSVIGYDDEPLAAQLQPHLTTVRIPFYAMGQFTAQHVLDNAVSTMPARTLLPCPLVKRASAAAPTDQEHHAFV